MTAYRSTSIAELGRLVLEHWDPIGVAQMDPPGPEDEYDSYLPVILAGLDGGHDEEWLGAYLSHTTTRILGKPSRPEIQAARDARDMDAARVIAEWHRKRTH